MTWLAWRQLRVAVLSVYSAVAVAGVLLAVTRLAGKGRFDQDFWYSGSLVAVYLAPALLGVFWGVPMITRELEAGTHHLVWNQGVTRTRWLAVKLGVGVPAALVAVGALSLAVTWWAGPVDATAVLAEERDVEARITPPVFAARGLAPVGYAAFALVLGVAVAIVVRRTVPAMAVTLVLYAAAQLVFPIAVRPHVLPPTDEVVAITADNIGGVRAAEGSDGDVPESLTVEVPGGAWVLTNETVDADGAAVFPLPDAVGDCLPRAPEVAVPLDLRKIHECFARLSDLGYRQHVAYLPVSRFWPLQWLELASYLALSAPVAWFGFRRLRHLF
ncbi:MAG: transporter [Saccharothrix sp.]|nr:transporter [Saccharothrix sp.]